MPLLDRELASLTSNFTFESYLSKILCQTKDGIE